MTMKYREKVATISAVVLVILFVTIKEFSPSSNSGTPIYRNRLLYYEVNIPIEFFKYLNFKGFHSTVINFSGMRVVTTS